MKRLIVTGDDFGISPKVNAEIERFHREGLLTQASLMVNGDALEEAVRIARRNPGLTVGLHLALCDAKGSAVSALTDARRNLIPSPARAGLRYAFDRRLRDALEKEIESQFERFLTLGFSPAYWDGHTHLHLHPTVLRMSLPAASKGGFGFTRLVREPKPARPVPLVFHGLSRAAIPKLRDRGITYADQVYGLSETGAMDMPSFSRIVASLGDGWSELYFHPGVDGADIEAARLLEQIRQGGVILSAAGRSSPSA